MQFVNIQGTVRSDIGKKASNALRKEEKVPCVMYAGGEETIHFAADPREVNDLIYTDEFQKANIVIDGKEYECILKQAQFHPVTDELIHVDFQRLMPGTPISVRIPVRLSGFAKGVQAGGRLDLKIRRLSIKALPKDLIDHIELDVTNLALGKSIKVQDLDLENIEVLNSPTSPVAQVTIPRALRGGGEEEEEGAEGTEEGSEEGGEGGEGSEAPAEQAAE